MPRMRSVLTRAGYPAVLSDVSPDILAIAKSVYIEALMIAELRAVSWRLECGRIPSDLIPPGLGGLCAYTILSVSLGHMLDEKIDERFAVGSPLEGALFDAWGSEAAEALVCSVDRVLRAEKGEGEAGSVRFAPGYGGFDVRNNAKWFDLVGVDRDRAGVRADPDTGVLSPRKSILCMIGWNT